MSCPCMHIQDVASIVLGGYPIIPGTTSPAGYGLGCQSGACLGPPILDSLLLLARAFKEPCGDPKQPGPLKAPRLVQQLNAFWTHAYQGTGLDKEEAGFAWVSA